MAKEWIPYKGKMIDNDNETATFSTTDGSGCTLKVGKGDFRKNGNNVEFRLGCKIVEILGPDGTRLG